MSTFEYYWIIWIAARQGHIKKGAAPCFFRCRLKARESGRSYFCKLCRVINNKLRILLSLAYYEFYNAGYRSARARLVSDSARRADNAPMHFFLNDMEARMLDILLPKGAPFFELLRQQNAIMCSACALVPRLLENGYLGEVDLRTEAAALEEEGDAVYLTIIKHLSQTFITPIDREDILEIAKEQERLTDLLNNLVARLYIFNMAEPSPSLKKIAHNINEMTGLTSSMLQGLSERRDSHGTRAFRALRDECEILISAGLEEVLDVQEMTPQMMLSTIKATRAFDRLEQAIEQVTDLAEALEEAVLKNV